MNQDLQGFIRNLGAKGFTNRQNIGEAFAWTKRSGSNTETETTINTAIKRKSAQWKIYKILPQYARVVKMSANFKGIRDSLNFLTRKKLQKITWS